jgi:hypothetical protein
MFSVCNDHSLSSVIVYLLITGIGNRTSCKQPFIALKILTLSSLYYFVSDIHKRNTRQVLNLYLYHPPTNLSSYQKGSYYMSIKLFNCLPLCLKQLYKDVKQFKLKLKEFFSCHSFYTLDEYFEYSSWKDCLYTGCFYVL